MSLLNISRDELVNEVDKSIGLTTFLAKTGHDQILLIENKRVSFRTSTKPVNGS